MLVPIALGLSWPERLADVDVPVDWTKAQSWDFEPLDDDAFPAVRLARAAGQAGGTAPAVYNAANEVCVAAFVAGRLRFTGIVDTLAQVLDEHEVGNIGSVPDVLDAERWARDRAAVLTSSETKDRA